MWFLGLCKNPHLHHLWGWSMTSGGQGAAAAGLSMSGELLLEAFLSLPAAPALTPTLFISPLKIFLPFLFSPLSPLLVSSLVSSFSFSPLPFSFLCSSLPLFSFSYLFIPSSTPLPSFYYCPFLSSPSLPPAAGNCRELAHQEYTNTGFEYFLWWERRVREPLRSSKSMGPSSNQYCLLLHQSWQELPERSIEAGHIQTSEDFFPHLFCSPPNTDQDSASLISWATWGGVNGEGGASGGADPSNLIALVSQTQWLLIRKKLHFPECNEGSNPPTERLGGTSSASWNL